MNVKMGKIILLSNEWKNLFFMNRYYDIFIFSERKRRASKEKCGQDTFPGFRFLSLLTYE